MWFLESQMARVLSRGENLLFEEGYVQFDDRLLQREMVERFRSVPEVAIFGSSTTMQISKDFFAGRTFFNHSLRRGVLEDYMAMSQLYRDRGRMPKEIWIGIDSWIFDPHHWRTYWKSIASEYQRVVSDFDISWKRDREEIHLAESFREGLSEFGEPLGWKKVWLILGMAFDWSGKVRATKENFAEEYVKRSDGSVGYHAAYRNQSDEEIEGQIEGSRKLPLFTIEEGSQAAFIKWVEGMQREGAKVMFYFPALHPRLFELQGRNRDGKEVENYSEFIGNLDEVEKIVRQIAGECDVSCLGSYRASRDYLQRNDFYDWIHLKPSGIGKVFSRKN